MTETLKKIQVERKVIICAANSKSAHSIKRDAASSTRNTKHCIESKVTNVLPTLQHFDTVLIQKLALDCGTSFAQL